MKIFQDLAEAAGDPRVGREGGELGRVPAGALGPVDRPLRGRHGLYGGDVIIIIIINIIIIILVNSNSRNSCSS